MVLPKTGLLLQIDKPSTSATFIPPTYDPMTSAIGKRRRYQLQPSSESGTSATIASDAIDLKVEITRMLEELIEKHPETLDAIESIRQNRLGRTSIGTTRKDGRRHQRSGQITDER